MTNVTFAGNTCKKTKYVIPSYEENDSIILGDRYRVQDGYWSINLGDKSLLGVSTKTSKKYLMNFSFYNKNNKLLQTTKVWCKSKKDLYII